MLDKKQDILFGPKRFYTYPEYFHTYPFLLVPFHLHRMLKRRPWIHAIVDSGVEIFNMGKKEYPKGFFLQYEFKAQQYTQIWGEKIWFVIPDYPDDYRHNPIENNVERTLENIERFSQIEGVNWIYPLQADYLNLDSFHYACHEVQKYHPKRVAIGTVCKTNNLKFITKCCMLARQHFPNAHIHAFGPTLKALPHILPFIDSWDSASYTFPRKHGQGKPSTKKRKIQYFNAYLKRIREILREHYSQQRLTPTSRQ